jgi:glycosyltransferase 2 family protein
MIKTSRRAALYWAAALMLAGVLLYYSLRGIDWSRVGSIISGADPALLAVSMVCSTASLLFRAIRWRILLTVDRKIGLWPVFCSNMAGYLGNNFLPARAGEVVRSTMISTQTGAPAAEVLTTALAERLMDVIVLVSWTPIVLWTMTDPPKWMAEAARPAAVIAAAGALALITLPFCGSLIERIIARLPLPEGLKTRLIQLVEHVLTGIRTFHDWGRFGRFVVFTAVIWSLDAFTSILVARALSLSLGIGAALLLLTGLGLGSALPSTPGYVGIYQFVAVGVLVPFGFSKGDALAYILVVQVLSYLVVLFWGLLGLYAYRLTTRKTQLTRS